MSSRPVESVWDYPRPPALEKCADRLRVVWPADDGCEETVIADTTEGVRRTSRSSLNSPAEYRVLETSHPPTYYIPRKDVDMSKFTQNSRSSFCEVRWTVRSTWLTRQWKGAASYFDVKSPVGTTVTSRAWTYERPSERFKPISASCTSATASDLRRRPHRVLCRSVEVRGRRRGGNSPAWRLLRVMDDELDLGRQEGRQGRAGDMGLVVTIVRTMSTRECTERWLAVHQCSTSSPVIVKRALDRPRTHMYGP